MAFMKTLVIIVISQFILLAFCDVFLHNPRGSNNRLREKRASRENNRRLFDSQNNNRGGYNVGIKVWNHTGNREDDQYNMKYYQSGQHGKTRLRIEWTNQHGCGDNTDEENPIKVNCQLILQYMCQPVKSGNLDESDRLRNGESTQRQDYQDYRDNRPESATRYSNRKGNSVSIKRGLHESFQSYSKCRRRQRNARLFTADQNLRNTIGATATRQNPNGNRAGYECPEERDYYPYWHPNEWKDIAVLVANKTRCKHFKEESFNVKPRYECWGGTFKENNETACKENGGNWIEFYNYLEKLPAKSKGECLANGPNVRWAFAANAVPSGRECLVKLEEPDCEAAPFTRVNHLGLDGDLNPPSYDWVLPNFRSPVAQNCVFRLRYNISSDDYNPYDWKNSPVKNNPDIGIGKGGESVKLAFNTAQIGRTFQDRSHVFQIVPRPAGVDDDVDIYNLNVKGKRGNIVQVYPAVQYDFAPETLTIGTNDALHIQWTGSNTHDNNPPGGDGQTGDDGEGSGGTDRNNLLFLETRLKNYFLPFEHQASMTKYMKPVADKDKKLTTGDIALQLASSGYFKSGKEVDASMNAKLNNAPPSFNGPLVKVERVGVYHYGCTRNNNFSNRSQKGTIIVVEDKAFKPSSTTTR